MSDIFANPISTSAPPSEFSNISNEIALPSNISNSSPIPTNNFYGNMLVGDQTCAAWTHPYSVFYSNSDYIGLAAYHGSSSTDRVFGPDASSNPVEYFYYPTAIKEFVLGAYDFDSNTSFSLTDMERFSANVKFTASNNGYLDCPLVQGMGFITGIYYNLTPQISSAVGITSVTGQPSPKAGIDKFQIQLNNNTTWIMYVTVPSGQSITFKLSGSNEIISSNSVDGCVIQLCKLGDSSTYDKAAGSYPTSAAISATVSGSSATYSLTYSTAGSSNNGTSLIFALPHHVASFTSKTSGLSTDVSLNSTTKGNMVGYLTNVFEMSETLPTDVQFGPWTSISGWSSKTISAAAKTAVTTAASTEANDDVYSDSNSDSMYTSGKILDKYAYVLYTVYYILQDTTLAKTLLASLQKAIERFTTNVQTYPLGYDTTWKGIISTANTSQDYGNSAYNDHHFHWGYHIHAVAIAAKIDAELGGSWLSTVKDWTNSLVRDAANPSSEDTYFPVYRSFDFFHGHSWAHGITASADGKDEESSSEDYNFSYAIKLWGNVIGDSDMEARGNLMLAIQARAMNMYMLYQDDNTTQPSNFIANKVSGILFENKIDHTTWFGADLQYIQGIHMLPITPISSFIRNPTFVEQEWTEKLAAIIDNVTDGWKGILMLNVALYDPTTAYNFFSGSSFSTNYLDNGMSKTWSLAYTALVGGST